MNNLKHDFWLLKWHYNHLKNPEELLNKLWFDNYSDFLYWMVEILPEWKQFWCLSCCRSLLPRLIAISEEKSWIEFNSLIKNKWSEFDKKQKEKSVSNYKHYFTDFDLTISRIFVLKCEKMYSEFSKI